VVVFLLFDIGVISYIYFVKSKTIPATKQGSPIQIKTIIPTSENIGTVGAETLYGSDANFVLSTSFETYLTKKLEKAQLVELVKKKLIEDSVTLQANAKESNISLPSTIFNSPDKDEWQRQSAVQKIRDTKKEKAQIVLGGMISMWFHNVKPPKIPLAQADQITKSKMESISTKLKNGSLTFANAAREIASDTSLAPIDPNYKGNASGGFYGSSSETLTSFPELDAHIRKLKSGETSAVIRIPGTGPYTPDTKEGFYTIVKIYTIKNADGMSFESWLEEAMTHYPVRLN